MVTQDWADRVRRLEDEVAGLRRGVRTRGLIEQAKGRLAERLGLDPEEAFRYLANRSQQTNVSVVDVAADVLAATDGSILEEPQRAGSRRALRLQAGLAAVDDLTDLVAPLADRDWLGAAAVALFSAEADGALRLLAAHGWPARLTSDWRWVPSIIRTPAAEAIRRAEPVWLEQPDGFVLIGPGNRRAALPITVGSEVVAALEVAFVGGTFDEAIRQELTTAAALVAEWLAAAAPRPESIGSRLADRWLEAVVDAAVTPTALLAPLVNPDGAIGDFRIEYANAAALDAWHCAVAPSGRRLLDLDPRLVEDGTFDAYVRAYLGLSPSGDGSDRCGAARLGGRLLATWRSRQPEAVGDVRLSTMERMGGFGWGEWRATSEPLACSPGLSRLLGRPAARRPMRLDRLLAAVATEDRPGVEAAIATVLRDGQTASAELGIRRGDGQRRSVLMVACPGVDHRDGTRTVLALFQDRTDARQRERQAAGAAERLATQRLAAGIERAQVHQLRASFFPPPWTRRRHGGLDIIARHSAPSRLPSFRGDFYELNEIPAGLLLAVGDVFGSGIDAAHTMVRLRHSTRVLALAGLGLADVIRLVNLELCGDEQPPLASLVLAGVDWPGRRVSWAQAGHYSPILVRNGRARSLRRPSGDILGLTAGTRYGRSTVQLQPADLLVFFTDGVFQHWDPGQAPIRRLAAECEQAQRDGGGEALVERLLPAEEDEACLVVVEWPGAEPATAPPTRPG